VSLSIFFARAQMYSLHIVLRDLAISKRFVLVEQRYIKITEEKARLC